MNELIRYATLEDIPSIRHIAESAWPVAYADVISSAQIEYMLELMYSEPSLLKQMQEMDHRFLLASDGAHDVGFASVGEIEPGTWKLHKLYVLPEVKGKGYGKVLLASANAFASEQGAHTLILQVNRRNPSYHFYLKQGFTVREETILDIGNGYVMDDYIMRRKIEST